MVSKGSTIVKRAAQRLAGSIDLTDKRPDLRLVDYQPLNRDSAKLLLAWSATRNQPTQRALENWVMANLEGVQLDQRTVRWWPHDNAVSVVASLMLPTRRVADAEHMACVAPNRYLESGTKHVWEVRESDNGNKYLIRRSDDNIDELLQRPQASTITFASLRGASRVEVGIGDTVNWWDSGRLLQGKVKSLKDNGDLVVVSEDKTYTARATSVTEVVAKDGQSLDDYKERIKDYYSRIFPPEYLKKWLGEEA